MITPSVVDLVTFFYPIGNTPAVCLTQDLPCNEDARLLLLGCGDVRNILFTAYFDAAYSKSSCYFSWLLAYCCQNHDILISHAAILRELSLVRCRSHVRDRD